jgi:sulfite reductase (NADPH) flavoprotein alpha-component
MLRRLHSFPGLLLAIMLGVTAVTGAILSVDPMFDRATNRTIKNGTSVAALAEAVATRHDSIERITVHPTGAVTVSYTDADQPGVERVDPATGAGLEPYEVSDFNRFVTNLHRSFLAGDAGRAAAGIGAVVVLLLTICGMLLLVRRLGGWGAMLRPIRGTTAHRWHGGVGRLAAVGLLLSSLTGVWMSADTFGFIPTSNPPELSYTTSGEAPAAVGSLAALRTVDVTALRDMTFPAPGERNEVFTLRTTQGEARIDPGTGLSLGFIPVTAVDRIQEIVLVLHTGRGAWVLGLLLGLSAAGVPALGITGSATWWRRRFNRPRIVHNCSVRSADTIILVGSEGNTTWGFAASLHSALTASGHRVHTATMNDLAPVQMTAERMLILSATYGDGAAPASAKWFLARLARLDRALPFAVLGFGDRHFSRYCQFAHDVSDALDRKGWPRLMPMKRVDRQSAQEFAHWGHDLGLLLGHDLVLEHFAARPKTTRLELVEREDFGAAVGAPIAILRFRAPAPEARCRARLLPRFEAGDLFGIVPPGSSLPRFYSLASSTREGVLEICVRLRDGGLCSTFLHGMRPGGRIEAFVRENPGFRPNVGPAPLILIGAGAGIGPLAGFVRANRAGRPVHLYWGGRSQSSDFLYEHELALHLRQRRLTSLVTAFSRTADGGAYVQDRIAADAPRLRKLIRQGAQILVCGGRDMAEAVTQTLDAIVRPLGVDLATLKSSGRYVEDVY